MIVTRRLSDNEQDRLINKEQLDLIVQDLGDALQHKQAAPKNGWTHDALEAIDYDSLAPFGWNAYLGHTDNWIGSSEV